MTNNQERFRKLMKEQSDLSPIVEAYTEYKKCKQDIEDSLAMLEEENDEDMRDMIKETLNESRKRIEELEQELKILLLPQGPPMMRRTSLWKSVQVQAEMRRRFLQRRFTVCMCIMQKAAAGRWKP